MDTVKIRAKILREMDNYARENFEEEDYSLDLWLSEGVPDGADDAMFLEFASDDAIWRAIVEIFGKCCKHEGII